MCCFDIFVSTEESGGCQWPPTEENERRREFCSRVEGYGSVCHCRQPAPITFQPKTVGNMTFLFSFWKFKYFHCFKINSLL